jgi:hypothetical protein
MIAPSSRHVVSGSPEEVEKVEGSDDRIAGEYNKKHEYCTGNYAESDHGPGREYESIF